MRPKLARAVSKGNRPPETPTRRSEPGPFSSRAPGAAARKATLTSWRDNHERFAAVPKGRPRLEAALPISADIAVLARAGLEAVAAIESGRAPGADWRGRAKEVLNRQAAAEKASESIVR